MKPCWGSTAGCVLNAALRITGSSDAAHDVHQEVFLAVWRIWDTFTEDTKWPAVFVPLSHAQGP